MAEANAGAGIGSAPRALFWAPPQLFGGALGKAGLKESMEEDLDPIHTVVDVPVAVVDAFRLFTEDIGRWWPLASHSIAQENATGCHIDGGPGGGLFETSGGGTRYRWGTIMTWEPPHRLSFTWHPGRQPDDHTMVEIDFAPLDEQRTRIELIHSGWQAGDEERHRAYAHAWEEILKDGYAVHVTRHS